MEDQHPQDDGDQRVEVVSDGRFDDVIDGDGVDVQSPVHRDEQRGGDQEAQCPAVPQQPEEIKPHECAERHREHEAPDDPVRDDLERVNVREQFPIQGERAPKDIA